jgi:hypothetical protein
MKRPQTTWNLVEPLGTSRHSGTLELFASPDSLWNSFLSSFARELPSRSRREFVCVSLSLSLDPHSSASWVVVASGVQTTVQL